MKELAYYIGLGVTKESLGKYMVRQTTCEICGREERVINSYKGTPRRLARDHDHKSGLFRGLLCGDCNRKLGWYENLSASVNSYILQSSDFSKVLEKLEG